MPGNKVWMSISMPSALQIVICHVHIGKIYAMPLELHKHAADQRVHWKVHHASNSL